MLNAKEMQPPMMRYQPPTSLRFFRHRLFVMIGDAVPKSHGIYIAIGGFDFMAKWCSLILKGIINRV